MIEPINQSDLIVLQKKDLTNNILFVKKDLRRYWTREEINQKLANIRIAKDRMLIQFLWMSGVRITEAINLKKEDVDFNNHLMKVRWLKSRKYHERVLPLHPRLKDLMILYTAAMNGADKVFPITRQRAWQLCQKYLEGHPHQLRHSFAVNWLMCGGDIVILHRIMGHKNIQTTMEYLKIVPVDQGKELIKITF